MTQTRTARRNELWVQHIRFAAELHGYWHSSKESRSCLPDAEYMTDAATIKALNLMVDDGLIERTGRGCYVPVKEMAGCG